MSPPPVSSEPSVQEHPEREDGPPRAAPRLARPRPGSADRIGARARWAVVAVVCVAIAAGSLAVQNAADFDPWGWIVWGREVLHLHLSTTQGPSWKPGAVALTTVFAIFGGLAPTLWVFAARLGALLAVVMAFRLGTRFGGWIAGVVAAVLLLVTHDFLRGAINGESEAMMVGFLLAGIEAALARRERAALYLLLFSSLLRPEVWLVLGAYSLYLWLTSPRERPWIVLAWGLLVMLWFGGDWWGSGNPFLSSERAKQFVVFNTWDRYPSPASAMFNLFGTLVHRPAIVLAIVAGTVALVRRDRVVVGIAVTAVAMLLVVVAMAQDGYPVLDRFLFGSVALVFVLAGTGVGYLVRFGASRHAVLGALAAVALVAILSPLTIANARALKPAVNSSRQWDAQLSTLPQAIAAAGGRKRILACPGAIAVNVLMTPTLAWDLDVRMTRVFSWQFKHYGIVFVRADAPLTSVESDKPLRMRTLAQTAGWRVLYVASTPRAPANC